MSFLQKTPWLLSTAHVERGSHVDLELATSQRNSYGMAMNIAIELVGWIGAGLILAAYILVSIGRLSGQSAAFQWMNVVGAAGFIINSGWHGAIPSTALNIVWLGIGVFTLWRIAKTGSSI